MQHAMQPQHFGAPPSYLNGGHIKSENGSERGVSPHPSDSSRYSSQQPQQQLPSYPSIPQQHMNGLRYPSPSQMQAPMPMLNNSNYIPNPPDHAYAQQQQQMADAQVQHQHNGGRPASDTGPPKAFACSTCGKGFARRSDLARHGKKLWPQHQKQSTDNMQNVSTAVSALTCATTPTAASSSFSAPPSRFTNVSTLARSLICASDAERYENSVSHCIHI